MYKKIFVVLVFLLIGLSACEKDEVIDDNTPDFLTYELDSNHFENFYEINYYLDFHLEGSYEVNLSIDEIFDFDITDLEVTLTLKVTEIYQDNEYIESYDIVLDDTFQVSYSFKSEFDPLMIQAYISEFDIDVSSGTIETDDDIDLKSFNYPVDIAFDKDKIIHIEDQKENENNYLAFMDLIESMDKDDINQMRLQTTEKTQLIQGSMSYEQQVSSEIKMQQDPFYLGYTKDGLTTHIESYEYDQYVFYETHRDFMHQNKYLVHPQIIDPYTLSSLIEQMGGVDQSEVTDDFYYSPDKMSFDKIEYGYRVDALLKDFMPEDAYQELVTIYQSEGLDTSVLEISLISLRLTFVNNIYELSISMAFNFQEPIIQTIRSKVTYQMNYNPFTPKYILDDDYMIVPGSSIDEVVFETDPLVSNTISLSPNPHVFKVYLEKGQYLMHVDTEYVLIDVLDQDGFEGNQFIGYQNPSAWDFEDVFIIDEDGYYYFVAHSNYDIDAYTFYAEKLEIESNLNEPKTLVLGNNDIEILSQYDFDYFTYDAPEDMYLEVSSDQTSLLFFQSINNKKHYLQNYYLFEFNVGRNWIYVEKGLNEIYFNHPSPIDANINVKAYGDLLYQSDNFSEMTPISDEFLDRPMFLGPFVNNSYLSFEAERAVYTFSYETSNSQFYGGIQIINATTNELFGYVYFDQTDTYDIIMEEGSYILVMSSGNYMELNLKVDKTLIENHITYETLSHVSTYDIDISEIPYVEGMLIDFYHQPRHRFTNRCTTNYCCGYWKVWS